ncbi:MAG TPA: leucyl/phenylalanyl-tRNA--protein transferase [Nitrospiraceae bacterium]|jgi:leucyl/phenylalanyl-tRNA--protein transferase|nr:leucyl/phenylalanyl-tRNA--protein transferase [Nitrospiraceae bacterium]
MPIFQLSIEISFPPPEFAEKDGLLAVGGDLSEERLLLAYSMGIFPWYSENCPILWWSPDPRLVLLPGELVISRSLRQTMKKGKFTVTIDKAFEDVVRRCANVKRKEDEGTWITEDMIHAYTRLHDLGFAHSVESWCDGELSGGLYGVSLGNAFFGESMFASISDASKIAFVRLVQQLRGWGFTLIDCQVTTRHLMSFGAQEISRKKFLDMLKQSIQKTTRRGRWHFFPAKIK